MNNQVEQIRAEVERQYINARGAADWSGKEITRGESLAFKQVLDFIDALLAKETPILVPESKETPIEVCGKKVVVRYARTQEEACASCAFCSRKECHDLDCNMRDIIGESVSKYAYFAEVEQSEEKDYKKLYEGLVNSEWYKKYYQGTSVGDSVAVEQPETDFDELIKQEMVKVYETYTRPNYIEENTTEAAYDFDAHIARHFYNLNPKHK